MSDISRLVVAWVSAQQRHFYASTRGIATPEQRMAWEREAEEIIAAHDREVAAQALRDAANEWSEWETFTASDGNKSFRMHGLSPDQWLRARADGIERDQV